MTAMPFGPAQAGTQTGLRGELNSWVPAYTGTNEIA
jgi:hypothetical protein